MPKTQTDQHNDSVASHANDVDQDELVFETGEENQNWDDDEISLDKVLIPDGIYAGVIESVEIKESKAGYDYYNLKLRLSGEGAADGAVLYEILSFSPKALPITAKTLRQLLGVRGGAFRYRAQRDELVGIECSVKVGTKNDPQYGEDNDVLAILPAGVGSSVKTSGLF